jgi:phosphate transport system permease protein
VTLRTTEDMLNLVPHRHEGRLRGARRLSLAHRRQRGLSGRAQRHRHGLLLAIARISGETAPLLFTALNNQFWSTKLNAPMANLPVVIFQFALSPTRIGRISPGRAP